MPRWRVPVELVLAGETSTAVARWADRALGAIVAEDADFYRAIGRRPPRYVLGAIRPAGTVGAGDRSPRSGTAAGRPSRRAGR
jgi:hypothetical protein